MSLKVHFLHILKSLFVLAIVIALSVGVTFAQQQEKEPEAESTKIVPEAIEINDISSELEMLGIRIIKLRSVLKTSARVTEIDSLLTVSSNVINLEKDTLLSTIERLSQRNLKVQKNDWEERKSKLKEYQGILDNRLGDVTATNEELVEAIGVWEVTREELKEQEESAEIFNSLENTISILNELRDTTRMRIDSIFLVQKKLTSIILLVDKVISDITNAELELQKDYFVFDSPPLFYLKRIDSIASDTTSAFARIEKVTISSGFKENLKQIGAFLAQNKNTAVFQALFLILLFISISVVKRKWNREKADLTLQVEKDAKVVLNHPISSTLAVGLLISAFFYKSTIPIISEIHILIVLGSTAFLLPKLTTKRFNVFMYLLFFVFILHTLEVYFNPHSLLFRVLLLLNSLVLMYALVQGRIEMQKNPDPFWRIKGLFKIVVPFFVFLLLISVLANLIGMVGLSNFLFSGVLSSTALGFVVFLSVKVFTSILVLLVKWKDSANIQSFSAMASVTQQRIKPILMFVGLIIWLIFTLGSFEIYDFLRNWFDEILLISWTVGAMKISLGGILSFAGIFVVAILIANISAAIFQDEWLVKVLPRGIAPAISLMLRIIIITVGLYVGLNAAGFPIEQVGFVLGALGVGIGFGLQNIVLNFISGLILAFERPINLGDTIEIDQEMGVVTNIGVRSSNIRTYSGAEAIIPNGDLTSKKVINWTLSNRNRRTRVLMKTSASADPEKVIEMFNKIASEHPSVFKEPAPTTLFFGFNPEGNLDFALHYWTSFSDTLSTDSDIALKIFKTLKEEGIQAPLPVRRIVSEDNQN
jgi:small-conductance mechanosensitive channel